MSWYYPLPSLGLPVPSCSVCFSNDPLREYWGEGGGYTCCACTGPGRQPPSVSSPTENRTRIVHDPLPSDDDVTAYHLEGMPADRLFTPHLQWLKQYHGRLALRLASVAAEAADRPPKPPVRGTHVGVVGNRVTVTFKVLSIRERAPHEKYGRQFLVVMEEVGTGAKLKWFTGEGLRLREGETYTAKATVKDHSEWNGWAETIVNRVSEEGADTKPKEYSNDEG